MEDGDILRKKKGKSPDPSDEQDCGHDYRQEAKSYLISQCESSCPLDQLPEEHVDRYLAWRHTKMSENCIDFVLGNDLPKSTYLVAAELVKMYIGDVIAKCMETKSDTLPITKEELANSVWKLDQKGTGAL